MNQQQPVTKYIKSNDFDALVEEYYHPTEKDDKGQPVFLNKRVIVSREEWIARKNQFEKEVQAKKEFFNHIFQTLDGVVKDGKKHLKAVKK